MRLPLPLLLLLTVGCTRTPKPDDTDDSALGDDTAHTGESGESGDSSHTGETGDSAVATFAFPPSGTVRFEHYATAGLCAECHANVDEAEAMRDAAGRAVGPWDLWGASTMANSARNPYWWAAVAAEAAAQPGLAGDIEATCMTCHASALVGEERLSGDPGALRLDDLVGIDDRARLGLDGVTCTVCHQIEDEGLGEPETFSGAFPVVGDHTIYGPHADPMGSMMSSHSGYNPVKSAHILDSGLCATCHTLETAAFAEDGTPTGEHHLEQSPYLEWRNSDLARADVSCADCHVPVTDLDGAAISTRIAHSPEGHDIGALDDRSPYGRHVFVGGNTFTLGLLRDNAGVLGVPAPEEAFDALLDETRSFLGGAASLGFGEPAIVADELLLPVTILNLSGHKLPTGYPSRRAWLHVVARDEEGTRVFESGAWDPEGRLLDAEGEVREEERAGGPAWAHVDELRAGDVLVYGVAMRDEAGEQTFRLLSASGYLLDNRLLPAGWDPAQADLDHTAPVGVEGDASFVPGGDTVRLRLPPEAVAVQVELLYLSPSPRHLAELATVDDPTVRGFLRLAESSPPTPETLASADWHAAKK